MFNMADEDDSEVQEEEEILSMKSSSSLQHMLAVIAEERKKETASFSISGGSETSYFVTFSVRNCYLSVYAKINKQYLLKRIIGSD